MGILVYSLLWAMQDLYHQPYHKPEAGTKPEAGPPQPDAPNPKLCKTHRVIYFLTRGGTVQYAAVNTSEP